MRWGWTAVATVLAAMGCSETQPTPEGLGGGGSGGDGGFDPGSGGGDTGVPQTCEEAAARRSYIGCEYWPTITTNARVFSGFEFAVVAANPTQTTADVAVSIGAMSLDQITIAPGAVATISLPWVTQLKGVEMDPTFNDLGSGLYRGGAFRLVSSVPITLYQFSPLEYELPDPPLSCPNQMMFDACYSFTNDASLLLPTTGLREEAYVLSYPTLHFGRQNVVFMDTTWINRPGLVAITATEDDTNVVVESTAHIRPGPGVAALTPGETGTYALDAGDVVLLHSGVLPDGETTVAGKPCVVDNQGNFDVRKCPTPVEYDLTGSHIVASKPVSVIGGHDCSFVPYDTFACDHLEESILGVETLGQDYVVTAPQSVADLDNPDAASDMFVRVLSAADDNAMTFDPAVHAPVTLNAGEWVEIGPVADDFRVTAAAKIAVAQYLVGGSYGDMPSDVGDPSMSLAIPVEQHRVRYTFLAPSTYARNFANLTAPRGTTITLDGQPVAPALFRPVGNTDIEVARVPVEGGSHVLEGTDNFGLVVYGYGQFTSYMFPGGLNLETVVTVPR